MAKIDRIKEEIGWLKLLFGALGAIDASLLGWPAQNYTTASRVRMAVAVSAAAIVSFAIAHLNRVVYRRLSDLEDA